MSHPKIISEKSALKTKLFDVKKVDLVLGNGSKRTHYIAERLPIVVVFPLTDENEIYLISEYRYMLNKSIIEAVAGHIEKGETPLSSAKRELKEEAGITAVQWEELARTEASASAFKSKAHLFLAKGLEIGKPEPLEDEEISLQKMSLDEAVKKVMNGEIYHSTTMLGILLLDRLKRDKRL